MNKIKLPKIFKPKFETELIRLGDRKDGGYLIPVKSILNTKKLISFGLGDNFSFEEDFYKKNKVEILCFDKSVNFKFFLKPFLFGNFKKLFQYIKYRIFFDGKNKHHIKKNIIPKGTYKSDLYDINENIEDINSILSRHYSENIFFKIDIEGSEYRILDQLIKFSSSMTGLVIEFHDCDLNFDKIKNFIEHFDLQIVHIHVNNWDYISKDFFPRCIEFTFSPPKFNKKSTDENKKYPTILDVPNNQPFKDLPIEFI